jgi:transposase
MKNDIRKQIREFQELKKSMAGSARHLIVAVDVSKRRHQALLMDGRRKVLRKLSFGQNWEGFHRMSQIAETIRAERGMEKIVVGMEPTAGYWKPLARFCELLRRETGVWEVVTVRTAATAANRRTLDSCPDKNDCKDAYNIGDLVSQGKCHRCRRRSIHGEVLCRLLRLYYRERTKAGALKTRLRQVYGEIFPELELRGTQLFSLRWRRVLKEYPTARELWELGERLGRLLCVYGRRRHFVAEGTQVVELAKQTVGVEEGDEGVRLELQWLWEELECAEERLEELRERMAAHLQPRRDYWLLQTIPGVGPILAAGFAAEIGAIGNFGNCKELVSFAGLDVIGRQSGNWQGERRMISKCGRKYLRTVAYQAAVTAVRCDGEFRQCYERALARQGERKLRRKALVKVADKMLRVVYGVLRSGQVYRHQQPKEEQKAA